MIIWKMKKKIMLQKGKVVPGIEPGLQESESWVLTITLHNRLLLKAVNVLKI